MLDKGPYYGRMNEFT